MLNLCIQCNGEILIKRARDKNKKFCNRACVSRYYRVAKFSKCEWCGVQIKLSKQKRFCSIACHSNSKKSTYYKQCERCGEDFLCKNKAYEKRGAGRFCSHSCASRKFYLNESFFHVIDSSEKAYWLGFIFADGYQNGQELVLNLQPKDAEHLKKLKKSLQSEHNITIHPENENNYGKASFRVYSSKLCEDLNKMGCMQAKSKILTFPNLKSEFISDFIRGVFDGDGCVYIDKRGYKAFSIYSASENFIITLHEVFSSVGIDLILRKQGSGFVIATGKQTTIQSIANFFYYKDAIRLDRKYLKMIS